EHDVRAGSHAENRQRSGVAKMAALHRTVSDDPRAQEWRRFDIVEVRRNFIRKLLRHNRIFRVPAIGGVAGVLGALAEILSLGETEPAFAAGVPEPRDADAHAGFQSRAPFAKLIN